MWNTDTDITPMLLLAAILYVYVGYPVLLRILTLTRHPESYGKRDSLPSVALIITVHNEADIIEKKLANTLELDYPANLLEMVVASDCSDDGTDEIVGRYAERGVRLLSMPARRGKTPTLVEAVSATRSDLLVFSDGNAMYQPDAILKIIEPFHDGMVGVVCGGLTYSNASESPISQGEKLYWDYENSLKALESRFNSLIGANGSIYALRREAFSEIDDDLSDDFGLPLAAYASGYLVKYQPSALSTEEAPDGVLTGFRKKSRFVAHQLTTLARLWPDLRKRSDHRFLFQIISHKLLRNLVPFILIALLAVCLMMPSIINTILLEIQLWFYAAAGIGYLLQSVGISLKLFMIPMYFCTVNAAAAVGVGQFLSRRNYAAWDD